MAAPSASSGGAVFTSKGAIMSDSIIVANATKNPAYCPYCMRCSGLVRMVKIEPLYWRCKCGAEHDERENAKEQSQ